MDFQSPQNGMYDPNSFIDPSAIANGQMNGARAYPMSSVPQKRDSTGATLSRSQTPSQQPQFGFQPGFSHTPSPTMQNQHFRPGQIAPQRMQTASPAQNPHGPQMSPMGFAQASPMGQGFDPNAGPPYAGVQLSQNLQRQQQEAQRRYAMQIQQVNQHQQIGNLAASNMAAQQRHHAGQMPGMMGQHPGMQRNMMPGQAPNMNIPPQAFLKNAQALNAQHGRNFTVQPQINGHAINLQLLYSFVLKGKGWAGVSQSQSWPRICMMMGIDPSQNPNAPAELSKIYQDNLGLYEQAWFVRQKSLGQANQMQPQMGAMNPQMSPTRPAIPGAQNNAAAQQEYIQQLQRNRAMQHQAHQQRPSEPPAPQQQNFNQGMPQPQQIEHTTPLQNNANLANMNGRSTPQTDGKSPGAPFDQHRKSMSQQIGPTPTPNNVQRHASVTPGSAGKAVEIPSAVVNKGIDKMIDGKTYKPTTRTLNRWTGLDFDAEQLNRNVDTLNFHRPNVPSLMEMGVVDIRALTMSIRSGLHAEARNSLDMLASLTHEQQITLELEKCEDLAEVLAEYAEDQLQILANDNPEVSDILDLTPYEDVYHNCQVEVSALQELPEFGTKAFDLLRTADRLLAITTIFRNLSFLEVNHGQLASLSVLKFFSNAIRLVGTRVLLLRTHTNTFDFMKDLITFFSNTSTKIVLPSKEDAYAILHFLCAFAPTPRPSVPVSFTLYNPQTHRYLPSAVDSLAKLLARDDPNRSYYKQIFVNEASSSPPYDLLTRAFALAIAVIPDRTTGKLHFTSETRINDVRQIEARIAEARKPYLMQGMLAADILASLAPGSESSLCRSWLESEDGWAASLLKFAMSLCSTDANMPQPQPDPRMGRNQRPIDPDIQGFHLIVHRALSMLKRLGEKSKGTDVLVKGVQTNGHKGNNYDDDDDDDDFDAGMETLSFGGTTWKVKADIVPKKETLLSALLTPSLDMRSLRQFCGIGYLDESM
ncbi:hypothetical protein B0J11DRAFT_9125 [Dendryphion nanum]|uniref:ARID domain-containing protein n=1 Tax=Dendryphion nanum TaxID=256645 RepID=A0A9P9EJI9_9PLEO|nr:hypothetical protein B0J11DRAFT_9125 [Dendryphion nanum]